MHYYKYIIRNEHDRPSILSLRVLRSMLLIAPDYHISRFFTIFLNFIKNSLYYIINKFSFYF